MFSKPVLKLLDAALLPSVLVFSVKLASFLLVIAFYGMPFDVAASGIFLSNYSDFYRANYLSNNILLVLVVAGFLASFGRLHYLSDAKISPPLSVRIADLGLSWLIVPLFQGYLRSLVWLFFTAAASLAYLVQGLLILSPLTSFAWSLPCLLLEAVLVILSLEKDFHSPAHPPRQLYRVLKEGENA